MSAARVEYIDRLNRVAHAAWIAGDWERAVPALREIAEIVALKWGVVGDEADDLTSLLLMRAWEQEVIPTAPVAWASTVVRNQIKDDRKVRNNRHLLRKRWPEPFAPCEVAEPGEAVERDEARELARQQLLEMFRTARLSEENIRWLVRIRGYGENYRALTAQRRTTSSNARMYVSHCIRRIRKRCGIDVPQVTQPAQ